MIIVLAAIFVIALIGLRPRKFANGCNTDYLSKENTICLLGIFAVLIFISHFTNFIPKESLGVLDKPSVFITGNLGQLMVAPFLFFSGYGIHQQYKLRGKEYSRHIPKYRMLKVYLMFILCWLLFAIVALYKNYDFSVADYLLSLVAIRDIGNTGWYVFVIIVLYLTTYVSIKIFHNHKAFIFYQAILILLFYVLLNKAGWGPHWYNTMLSYFLGICFSYWKDKFDKLTKTRLATIITFLISGVLLFVFFYVFPNYTTLNTDFDYACLNLFFDLCIVCFLKLFSFKSKILTVLGKNVFWIYMLQMLPMEIFQDVSFLQNRYAYLAACIVTTAILVFGVSKVFNYLWKLFFENSGYASENTNIKIGIGISYVALAVSIIATLIVTPKVLAAVGDEQYGLYSFVGSITSWLTVITGALSTSYVRFATKVKKETGKIGSVNTLYFKIYTFFSIFIVIAMFAVVGILYACNFKISQYTDAQNNLIYLLLLISTINVAITIMFSIFSHYLTYSNQFIFLRLLSLIISILTFGCNLIFAVTTKSIISIAIVATVLSGVSALATVIYAMRHQKMEFEKTTVKKQFPLLKEICIFSSFILLNVVVDQIDRDVDKTLLGSMVDAKSVTIYSFAQFFNTYLLTLSISISGAFTPKIHELVENKDQKGLHKVFLDVCKMQCIVVVASVGGYIACGRPFIDVWLGEGYQEIYGYACVLLAINIIPLTANLGIEAQRAMNKHKFRAVLYIALALVNVALSILFIKILPPEKAIWGAVFGTVFSVVIGNCIILNIYNKKAIGLPMGRYFLNLFKICLFAAAGVGAAIGVSYAVPSNVASLAQVFIYAGIFLVIYLGLLAIFERETIKQIISKFKKKKNATN
ncbi:MAG: acyltransferase family protein [Bacilli bacterium]|nr:acyltransferase family protein [Bacilli bacterium]